MRAWRGIAATTASPAPLRKLVFCGMPNNSIRYGIISMPSHVLIIGASGELGAALARHYAESGAALSLWGRDTVRLQAIAQTCRAAGAASIQTRSLDLTEVETAVAALSREDHDAPFTLAVIVSGLGNIRAEGHLFEDPALVVNLGIVNFVAPAALAATLGSRMAARKGGAIVLIGSAAAFHALPFAAAYAGSKAGLARFADALRIAMRPHGVSVTLVSPGFIDTAAARAVPGPKPLILSPGHAARKIAKAAARGKAHLVMPWPFKLLRIIDRVLPRPLRDKLLRALAPPGR